MHNAPIDASAPGKTPVPTLQIRQLPDLLYQQLVFRAEQAHRSLNQQAVAELNRAMGAGRLATRPQALQVIRNRIRLSADQAQNTPTPDQLESWQHEDRSR